jgi:enoyl-CoA hydratase/carnithine racemase
MMEELESFWLERQRDFDTRVIVLSGAGEKGFSSGLDMKDATSAEGYGQGGSLTGETAYNNQTRFSAILRLMRSCPQPVIAAVHG